MRFSPLEEFKLKRNRLFLICVFICIICTGYADEKLGKLKLDSESEKEAPKYGLYVNMGYFEEISSKGNSLYLSTGVHYRASESIEIRMGLFYDQISGSSLSAGSKDTHNFVGFEFALNYFPFENLILRPYIGFQISATIIEEIYNRNSFVLGFKVQPWEFISLAPYYSIAHTVSPSLYGFTSHYGGAAVTVHF